MSDNESVLSVEELTSGIIDKEKLIIEVERRQVLYDKKMKDYSNRYIKEKLWREVCENVIDNWTDLSDKEKHIKGKEVQTKWKNLKDCFARELAKQRSCTSGQAAKKRRKYTYFDSMLFLIPTMDDRATTGNLEKSLNDNEGVREFDQNDLEPSRRSKKKSLSKPSTYESQLLQILEKNQEDEIDEDKSFALMLVPMLKKFNEDQKHFAKTEILNVMNRTRNVHPPTYHNYTNMTYHTQEAQYNRFQRPENNTQNMAQIPTLRTSTTPIIPQNYVSFNSAKNQYSISNNSRETISPISTNPNDSSEESLTMVVL